MEAIAAAALWAGANLGLMLLLGINVSRLRVKLKIGVGTGGNEHLERAVRAHGNNTEFVPGLIICLVMLALLGEQAWVIHSVGAVLLLARILQAYGIQVQDKPLPVTRVAGNLVTWILFAGVVVRLIWLALVYVG